MTTLAPLVRQRLRRDRTQIILWLLGTALLAFSSISGVQQSYGSTDSRQAVLTAVMANPVIMLFRGLPSGVEKQAFALFLIFPFLAMMAAFMSTFLAVRHTRMDEELGRSEMIAATPAGRTSPLVATVLHGVIANALLGVLVVLAFLAGGYRLDGSLVSGLATAAVGLAFLGVGLVAGQLMRTSRGANSLAVWVLIATFLIAGLGNALGTPSANLQRITSSWLTWLSPFGWAENSRPFDSNDVGPVLLCVGFGVVLAALSLALQQTRDLGESFVAERLGRRDAPAALSSPTGLAWRLTWGATLGWAIGGLITGLLSTSLAAVVSELGAKIPSLQAILTALSKNGNIQQGMVVIFFVIVGVLGACAAVQTVSRARQEEAHGTAEPVLATPVHRVRWFASFVVMAFVEVIIVCAASVVGAWLGVVAKHSDASLVRAAAIAASGQLAAASVFLVVTALVFVLLPRLTIALGWTLVMVGLLLGMFGALFGLPDAVVHLSPFADVPTLQGDTVDVQGLWWLVLATVAGGGAALTLMRRRELAAGG